MEFTFKDIRESYTEIKQLLEKYSWEKVNGLNTKIAEDLELLGDDNYDFLELFVNKYELDYGDFDYCKHFDTEAELFSGWRGFNSFILLPHHLIKILIQYIFPSTKYFFEKLYNKNQIDKKDDLTFGDLVVWKLKGSFCLRNDTKINLKF